MSERFRKHLQKAALELQVSDKSSISERERFLLILQARLLCFETIHSGLSEDKLRLLVESYTSLSRVLVPTTNLVSELSIYYSNKRRGINEAKNIPFPDIKNYFETRSLELLERDIAVARSYQIGEISMNLKRQMPSKLFERSFFKDRPTKYPIALKTLIRWEKVKIRRLI